MPKLFWDLLYEYHKRTHNQIIYYFINYCTLPCVIRCKHGYLNSGRTRQQRQGEPGKWNFRHWVFRRAGRPCWVCETPITMDRLSSSRITFWCPCCQQTRGKWDSKNKEQLAPFIDYLEVVMSTARSVAHSFIASNVVSVL